MKKEYIIWGTTQGSDTEQVLLTKVKGELITDKQIANYWAERLINNHNCKYVRIQEICFTDGFNNNFLKSALL